jgi:hypothetical protein
MVVVVAFRCARTGRVGSLSTTGFAMITAAIRPVLELDGVVSCYQRQLLEEGQIRVSPVADNVAGMGTVAHPLNLAERF